MSEFILGGENSMARGGARPGAGRPRKVVEVEQPDDDDEDYPRPAWMIVDEESVDTLVRRLRSKIEREGPLVVMVLPVDEIAEMQDDIAEHRGQSPVPSRHGGTRADEVRSRHLAGAVRPRGPHSDRVRY
jgi:hypothetical protein